MMAPTRSQTKGHQITRVGSKSSQEKQMIADVKLPYNKKINETTTRLKKEEEDLLSKIKTNNNTILKNNVKIQSNEAWIGENNFSKEKNKVIINQHLGKMQGHCETANKNTETSKKNEIKINENEIKIKENEIKIKKNEIKIKDYKKQKKEIKLQTGNEKLPTDHNKLKKKIEKLRKENSELRKENSELRIENSELRKENSELRIEKEKENNELQIKIDELQITNNNLQKNIDKRLQENADLKIVTNELQTQNTIFGNKIDQIKKEIAELGKSGSATELWYVSFANFKQETKAASTFAKEIWLWEKYVQYFFIDDNVFGKKDFIPGLFVYPAFQKLCSENIETVSQYDCNLYSVTKRLFDLNPVMFVNEAEYQEKILDILGDIFTVQSEQFSSSSGSKVRSISKNNQQICLIEIKHRLFRINCDPIYQVGTYYSNMLESKNFVENYTYPMLLLVIVGNQYYVYGGINYKKKVQVFYINSFSTKNRDSFQILYNIIQFLSETITEKEWPEYGPVENNIFDDNDVVSISKDKQVFLCKGMVYKFSSSYDSEAHNAIENFTPKLRKVQKINGEFMIEMEYLEDYDVLTKEKFKELNDQNRCTVIITLIRAIKTLHEKGYVHGDIRMPNIMVKTQDKIDLKIIDFEFAGKEGTVYYPNLNGTIQWGIEDTKEKSNEEESFYSYKKITYDNDLFMLNKILNVLLKTKVQIPNLEKLLTLIENMNSIDDLTTQLRYIKLD